MCRIAASKKESEPESSSNPSETISEQKGFDVVNPREMPQTSNSAEVTFLRWRCINFKPTLQET